MILFDPEKASHLMKQWDVHVLLPHTLLNAGYLVDHWKHDLYTSIGPWTTFDRDEPYQLLVGLPQDRQIEPFVTCRRASEEGDMYNWDVWIQDRRVWGPDVPPRAMNSPLGPAVTDPYIDPYEAAVDALRERGLERATIGIERRFLGIEAFEKLQRLLPEATFRDALGLFHELRMVKTEEEIRRMRIVAAATQEAYRAALKCVQPGMTGLDFEHIFAAEHSRCGCRHARTGAGRLCRRPSPLRERRIVGHGTYRAGEGLQDLPRDPEAKGAGRCGEGLVPARPA